MIFETAPQVPTVAATQLLVVKLLSTQIALCLTADVMRNYRIVTNYIE